MVAARMGDLWMRFLLRRGGAWIIYCSLMRHMGESWYEESYHRSGTGSRSKNRAGSSDGGLFFRRESYEDGTDDDGSGGGGGGWFFASIALKLAAALK